MNITLIYGTYSSGTLSVAELMQGSLQKKGHTVTIIRNDQVSAQDLEQSDAVIMGSPSWKVFGKQGMPHEEFYPMMDQLKGNTFAKPFAVYALGDASYALVCGAADHLQSFVTELGGTEIIKPLKIEGFYFAQAERTSEIEAWIDEFDARLQKQQ